jgi:hypothetical protein
MATNVSTRRVPRTSASEVKSRVSLVVRSTRDRQPERDGASIPGGGTAEFWARKDEYAATMKRPAKTMGRPFV